MLKIQELREIIRLIDQSSIHEFTFEQDGAVVSIKKPVEAQVIPEQTVAIHEEKDERVALQVPKEQQVPVQQEVEKVVPQTEIVTDENVVEIVSPMVGTFYRKPSPDSDTFVEIGDKVTSDSIVCIVEAMKLFNEIEAETTGEIVEILVNDGELVEYGQALFIVKTK